MNGIAWTRVASPIARLAAAGALLSLAASAALAGAPKVLPTTPAGITLVEVVLEGGVSQPVLQFVRVGDADGRTVFAYDQDAAGVSKCVDACAQEFQPLTAERSARAFGDWSLIDRARRPPSVGLSIASALHLDQGERAGSGGRGRRGAEKPRNRLAVEAARRPPCYRRRLAGGALHSGGIAGLTGWPRCAPVPSAQAVTLADPRPDIVWIRRRCHAATGNSARQRLRSRMGPVIAPSIASGSATSRRHTRRWLEAMGLSKAGRCTAIEATDCRATCTVASGANPRWTLAVLSQNFRPAQRHITDAGGLRRCPRLQRHDALRQPFHRGRNGGHSLRDNFTCLPMHKGKQLGAGACIERPCAERRGNRLWRPPMPSRMAFGRSDQASRWQQAMGLQGYALYIFAGDKRARRSHRPGGIRIREDRVQRAGAQASPVRA